MEPVERLSTQHRFTIRERLGMLAEWEQCLEPGQKSAYARRMKVSPGTLTRWARLKRAGLLVERDGKENAYMMKHRDRVEFERLKRENAQLQRKLQRSEAAVEVLGKASALLESLAKSAALDDEADREQQIPAAFRRDPGDSSSGKPGPS